MALTPRHSRQSFKREVDVSTQVLIAAFLLQIGIVSWVVWYLA